MHMFTIFMLINTVDLENKHIPYVDQLQWAQKIGSFCA
jgi:hypothetical protein